MTTIRIWLHNEDRIIRKPLNEYLRGVVPSEMPPSWPMEALKAMAVASRTYSMQAIKSPRHGDQADVCDWVHCHVYKPESEHARTNQALDETSGLILTCQGQIISALYSAYCNGHTVNNEDAWRETPVPPKPYLRGVHCPCQQYVLEYPEWAIKHNYNSSHKYGHGVGLCQVGAMAMAEAGVSFQEILAHYYQNTTIESLISTP